MVGHIDLRRRFLTSLAVHPAEGVSPAALLQSLVAIARDVESCYRSASFPTHRRSVREVTREVGILLQFFEAVQEHRLGGGAAALLPDSAVLSLCDLHVTFQRIRHLVRDCGRGGARLWLLMRSDRTSCEFRILVRSVATALDVLPLPAIDVPREVKELVRLVAEQSWKVQIGTDHADALVSKEVLLILDQFEKGVGPDLPQLRRVLSHLQIRSWADCNEEVLFLEEELGAALSSGGELGEISLLSSLRGLMLYSRAVVFEHMVGGQRSASGGSQLDREGQVLRHLNLRGLRCPISLDFMADPVTVSTGQTYDRASITRWLKSGNRTCPVTGEKLQSTVLVPNSTLQKLIRQACNGGGQQYYNNSGDIIAGAPWSSAAVGAVKMLCDFLVSKLSNRSAGGRSSTTAAAAVYEIRLLTKACAPVRGYLVEAGAISWLLKLLSPSITHPSLQEGAMAAILNLSKHSRGRKVVFESGGLDPILRVLREGLTAAAQQNAAASIFYLSSVEEHRREIGDAIPALVALLRNGGVRGKKSAAVALFGLLLFPGNHRRVLGTGAASDLIDLLSSEREDLVGDCLAVLAALAERPEGACAVLLSPAAVPSLARLLASSSSPAAAKECCIATLLHLCNNGGGRTRVARLLNGLLPTSLMPALYMVLAQGSPRAAKIAGSLISILHEEGREGPPGGAVAADAQVLQQEWAVPVQQ